MARFYRGIGFRLFAIFFALFIVLLSASGLAFYSQSESVLRDQMLMHLSDIATLQKLRVNDAVNSEINELRLFASQIWLLTNSQNYLQGRTSSAANITINLSAQMSATNYNENIFLLDKNGYAYLQAKDSITLTPAVQRLFYEKGSNEFSLLICDLGDGPHIYICGPMILGEEHLGVAVIEKNVAALTYIVNEIDSKFRSEETVLAYRGLDGEAIFILGLKFGNETTGVIPSERWEMPIIHALSGNETIIINNPDYRGVPILSATRYIESCDLGLVTKIDVSEAYEPINQIRSNFIIFGLIVLPLILVTSYLFSRSVSTPLSKLKAEVDKVGSGSFYVSKVSTAGDEIGSLQSSFVEMVEKLRLSFEQIEEKNRQLERLNRELETFSYSVSHDLRAPLRSIDGFSKVLLEDYDKSLDETGRDHLYRVRAATQRMGQLIDDLLYLSRITQINMVSGVVDLSRMAQSIAEELTLREPDRRVEWRIQPDLLVSGDAALLKVVIDNLLRNAWKFTSKKDRATIEVGATEINGEKAFYVRDDGAGFDMQYVHKLFTPFQRLHSVEDFPGTGIGLALIQRVINRHEGHIWAEGEEGRGATFYFTIKI